MKLKSKLHTDSNSKVELTPPLVIFTMSPKLFFYSVSPKHLHIAIKAYTFSTLYILHNTSIYAMIPSLAEALANRSQGGRVIEPARYEYPTSTPILPTNAGYDQPPPAYDIVAADTAPGEQLSQAALPSYYDLYKDEEVKSDETGTQGNTTGETNSPEAQGSAATTNRDETQTS